MVNMGGFLFESFILETGVSVSLGWSHIWRHCRIIFPSYITCSLLVWISFRRNWISSINWECAAGLFFIKYVLHKLLLQLKSKSGHFLQRAKALFFSCWHHQKYFSENTCLHCNMDFVIDFPPVRNHEFNINWNVFSIITLERFQHSFGPVLILILTKSYIQVIVWWEISSHPA